MVDNLKRGLMVGRFQPFHKGHLCLVGQIFEDCDEVVIAIGSAQINYSFTEILKPRFSRRKEYNGTNIRKLMSRSHRWKKLVPDSVAGIIEQIDGVTRIRFLLNEKLSERKMSYDD